MKKVLFPLVLISLASILILMMPLISGFSIIYDPLNQVISAKHIHAGQAEVSLNAFSMIYFGRVSKGDGYLSIACKNGSTTNHYVSSNNGAWVKVERGCELSQYN